MSKTIHIDVFDPASIDAAIREIREYSKWVESKAAELQERVATLIANSAMTVYNNSIADDLMDESMVTGNVAVYIENDGNVTLVIADGEDAIFMEFGAGVFYNGPVGSSPNPWGAEFGYTIGSYGKGNGAKQVWGFKDANGDLHLTHGVPASMPLYKAVQSVSRDIVQIAREVFASD